MDEAVREELVKERTEERGAGDEDAEARFQDRPVVDSDVVGAVGGADGEGGL